MRNLLEDAKGLFIFSLLSAGGAQPSSGAVSRAFSLWQPGEARVPLARGGVHSLLAFPQLIGDCVSSLPLTGSSLLCDALRKFLRLFCAMPQVPPPSSLLPQEETPHAEIRRLEAVECDPYRSHASWEPSMAVHHVFSRPIPKAFGIDFFRRLVAASPQPPAAVGNTAH